MEQPETQNPKTFTVLIDVDDEQTEKFTFTDFESLLNKVNLLFIHFNIKNPLFQEKIKRRVVNSCREFFEPRVASGALETMKTPLKNRRGSEDLEEANAKSEAPNIEFPIDQRMVETVVTMPDYQLGNQSPKVKAKKMSSKAFFPSAHFDSRSRLTKYKDVRQHKQRDSAVNGITQPTRNFLFPNAPEVRNITPYAPKFISYQSFAGAGIMGKGPSATMITSASKNKFSRKAAGIVKSGVKMNVYNPKREALPAPPPDSQSVGQISANGSFFKANSHHNPRITASAHNTVHSNLSAIQKEKQQKNGLYGQGLRGAENLVEECGIGPNGEIDDLDFKDLNVPTHNLYQNRKMTGQTEGGSVNIDTSDAFAPKQQIAYRSPSLSNPSDRIRNPPLAAIHAQVPARKSVSKQPNAPSVKFPEPPGKQESQKSYDHSRIQTQSNNMHKNSTQSMETDFQGEIKKHIENDLFESEVLHADRTFQKPHQPPLNLYKDFRIEKFHPQPQLEDSQTLMNPSEIKAHFAVFQMLDAANLGYLTPDTMEIRNLNSNLLDQYQSAIMQIFEGGDSQYFFKDFLLLCR